uniref:DNL-type domain-containing protein n=1 Tax=Compsopogon caeruleus TaxID=31354 RepID=A0A7S1XBY6_9RHOD|mmetsp:Transcript_13626/g.27896  ORF Transcript_13626/g.27896 Transcript_13626/m.27896 type:complete len:181 (+) Transcript_13626:2684-3226(+)
MNRTVESETAGTVPAFAVSAALLGDQSRYLRRTWSAPRQRRVWMPRRQGSMTLSMVTPSDGSQPRESSHGTHTPKSRGPIEHDRMGVAFTCGVCEHRVSKKITKKAFTTGVVIIVCPQCDSKHLIADNLGWYRDWVNRDGPWNVADFAIESGQAVRYVQRESLAVEDLATLPTEAPKLEE